MKILFVLSRDVIFFHGSGEVEAKILQVGLQLLGHECHIAGLDSGDFFDYDTYFFFSMRPDVLDMLRKTPQLKSCVVIPQMDDLNAVMVADLNQCSQHLDTLAIVGRTHNEFGRLNSLFPGRRCLLVPAWFLKPFIHEEKLAIEYSDKHAGYCLSMTSVDRDNGLPRMAATCREVGVRLHVVSDRPDEHRQRLAGIEGVTLLNFETYGSLQWYMRLENCSSLYEPNPRLTTSILEALWMGKTVYSPHAEYINMVLGANLISVIFDRERQLVQHAPAPNISETKQVIYRYHANFVAESILNSVGGNAHV